MAEVVLRMVGVRAWRGGRLVLDGVDAAVRAGELVVLTGDNGAGKSTLLQAAAGLVRVEGTVEVGGRVGWMGEAGPLRRTVDGLLALVVAANGAGSVAATRRRIRLGDGPIDRMSAGERRRALLAAAVVHEPQLLLLDEPLTHLDAAGMEEVHAVIAAERARGAAVVVATHFPERFVAEQRWSLRRGRLP